MIIFPKLHSSVCVSVYLGKYAILSINMTGLSFYKAVTAYTSTVTPSTFEWSDFLFSNSSSLWWQLLELDGNHCFFVISPWLVVKVVNNTQLEPFDCVYPFQITFWPSSAVRTSDLISSETHRCPLNDDREGYMRAWRRRCCQRAR